MAIKEYALYQGDEFIEIGTLEKLAKLINVRRETIKFYTTKSYRQRLKIRNSNYHKTRIVIPLDSEIDNDGVAI